MAWNEPGGGDRDPWGKKKNNEGPPDLDELFGKIRESFAEMFGGGGNKGGNSGGGGQDMGAFPIYVAIVVFGFIWLFQSFYTIDEKERGVVLRFGEYSRTLQPGLKFAPWLIDTVEREEVTKEQQYDARGKDSIMLTKDGNIVQVPLTVQYNISDIQSYILNIKEPTLTLNQATDSAIRHVVGSTNLDAVLGEGRQQMASEVKARIQQYLDDYGAGINVIDVNLLKAEPPEEVRQAFDDVEAAKQDKNRLTDQAEAYRNEILPKARGEAQKMIEEANAYSGQLVARAEGDASRFNQLLAEYERAPKVTRERLYIDAIEEVFANSNKVMMDVEGGNNMLYLPLDQINQNRSSQESQLLDAQQVREIVQDTVRELQRNSSSRSR